MTNAQIIFAERVRLLKEGKIGATGRFYTGLDLEGNETTFPEPEEIHTFAAWKAAGYAVKKGAKAIAKFPVWKYSTKTVENEDGEEEEQSRMFMKTAAFFSREQVERMVA